MFIDKVKVLVKAGDGGKGIVSFRQEKFIDRGGPNGGDGGKGGNVVLVASNNQNTLAKFRFQREIVAENGSAGDQNNMHGKSGKDIDVPVPVGTMLLNENGELMADLFEEGQRVIIAKGGKGGFGNAHFKSSVRQAPRVAEKGEKGDAFAAILELKMIADVGLVGLPNAGKSTLLSVVSNARPEIADYPFTTIRPNLGVVDVDKSVSMLFADIPGLIDGASEGKGLGDDFLRHVERTKVLVHLIDSYNDDVVLAYGTIMNELAAYIVDMTKKPMVVVLTKIEGLDDEITKDHIKQLKKVVPKGTEIFAISSTSGKGLKELLYKVADVVKNAKDVEEAEELERPKVITLIPDEQSWQVTKLDEGFLVTGRKIEKFAMRTNFGDFHGEQRLRDIMRKMGIQNGLDRAGLEPGDTIIFGKIEHGRLVY